MMSTHPQGCKQCHEPAGTISIIGCTCVTDCNDEMCKAAPMPEAFDFRSVKVPNFKAAE